MTEELVEIVKALEELAPHVWSAAVAHVRASLIGNVMWSTFFLLVGVMLEGLARARFKAAATTADGYRDQSDLRISAWLLAAGAFAAVLLTLVFACEAANLIMAPEWSAIRALMSLVVHD